MHEEYVEDIVVVKKLGPQSFRDIAKVVEIECKNKLVPTNWVVKVAVRWQELLGCNYDGERKHTVSSRKFAKSVKNKTNVRSMRLKRIRCGEWVFEGRPWCDSNCSG